MDNTEIIEKCTDGDRTAMEALYRGFAHKMLRIVWRYVADADAAEDILHDGFLIIFTRIREIRKPEKLESWMGMIMRNLSLDYLRQLDSAPVSALDEGIELPAPPEMEELLPYEELEKIIDRLPDGYRAIFKLAVLENKSHAEIGKLLGIAPHTSSSQLFRAKMLLRKMISERQAQLGLLCVAAAVCIGLFIFRGNKQPQAAKPLAEGNISEDKNLKENRTKEPTKAPLAENPPQHHITTHTQTPIIPTDITEADTSVSIPDVIIAETVTLTDSTTTPVDTIEDYKTEMPDYQPFIAENSQKNRGWTATLDYSAANVGRNPDEYAMDSSPGGPSVPILHQGKATHALPISFGIGISKPVDDRFSIETGLRYTLLRSSIDYWAKDFYAMRNYRTSYLGVPLKLNYSLWHTNRFAVYLTAGGQVDFVLDCHTSTKLFKGEDYRHLIPGLSPKTQFSIFGGVGFQYSITPRIGIYAEPSIKHYFNNGSTLPTYWQEHNTTFSLPVGIRITW